MNSKEIWKNRAANSGLGSRGARANYKADYISNFVKENKIDKIIDFGCGDLIVAKDIEVGNYVGVDIVDHKLPPKEEIKPNSFKVIVSSFDEFDENETSQLVINLDMLYHILENESKYLEDTIETLYNASEEFIIIYAQDSFRSDIKWSGHMFNSPWRQILENNYKVELVKQEDEFEFGSPIHSDAVFFVYRKTGE